jgi:hypothetical protein
LDGWGANRSDSLCDIRVRHIAAVEIVTVGLDKRSEIHATAGTISSVRFCSALNTLIWSIGNRVFRSLAAFNAGFPRFELGLQLTVDHQAISGP